MPRQRVALFVSLIAVILCGGAAQTGFATDPTKQIDQSLRSEWSRLGIEPAARCSDREFVRRSYLDLAGRIPTPSETDTFLQDNRDQKRQSLIDQLLASEDHAQHFADLFDVLLMGRGDAAKVAERVKHGWRGYLESVFRDNRGWDEVAREVLLARPQDPKHRGAVWFLHERNNQHQAIAEAIAPAFFGVRIECAQCHDHMMVDEIKQEHYWGLVAFFNRSENRATANGPGVAESAIGGFSEFANLHGDSSPNRLAFLDAEIVAEPRPDKDTKQIDAEELYVSSVIENEPKVPKFSRREQFVENVLHGHPLVARAMVNRVWAILMGRGIVHPFDEIDSVHPPSHPELFDSLAADFAANGYDVRRLTRIIAMSEAYELQSIRPASVNAPETFAWYLERPLTAEQLARSIQLVMRGEFQNDAAVVSDLRGQFLDVLPDAIEIGIADALYFSNAESLHRFIHDSKEPQHLISQLLRRDNHTERAEWIVERAFGRSIEPMESAAIVQYLQSRETDLSAALGQVLWATMTSAEFRFNH